jgi:hypothetical protein
MSHPSGPNPRSSATPLAQAQRSLHPAHGAPTPLAKNGMSEEKKLHAAMSRSFVTSYPFGAEAILQHWLWKTLKNATQSFGPLLQVFDTDYDATTNCGTDAWAAQRFIIKLTCK